MKKLKFCFSTTDYLLSKGIRASQGTDFSHSFVEWEDERYKTTLLYEAKGLDTHIINRDHLDAHARIICEFEVETTDLHFEDIMNYIYQQIGRPYGWKEILGYAIKRVLQFVGIKIRNPFPTDALICSEAMGNILVIFFSIKADVHTGDMDLNWLYGKLKNDSRFIMTKGK